MRLLRRRAITQGLFGGSRGWLLFGGLAWVGRWFRNLFGTPEPTLRYSGDVGAGDRFVLVHEADSPLQKKKQAKKDAKVAKKDAKAARKAARRS